MDSWPGIHTEGCASSFDDLDFGPLKQGVGPEIIQLVDQRRSESVGSLDIWPCRCYLGGNVDHQDPGDSGSEYIPLHDLRFVFVGLFDGLACGAGVDSDRRPCDEDVRLACDGAAPRDCLPVMQPLPVITPS